MARQFSEVLPHLGNFYDAIAEPKPPFESVREALDALPAEAREGIEAVLDWAPSAGTSLAALVSPSRQVGLRQGTIIHN
mgnify:FL=1